MNVNEYAEEIVEGLKTDGIESSVVTSEKNNGVVLTGIELGSKRCSMRPVHYVNKSFENNVPVKQEVEDLAKLCGNMPEEPVPSEITGLSNGKLDLNDVYPKIINAKKNEKYLNTVPHVFINDLAVVFYINVKSIGGIMVITNYVQDSLHVTVDTLYEYAKRNITKITTLTPMSNFLNELLPTGNDDDKNENDLLIISNKSNMLGAAAAFVQKDILRAVSESYGKSDLILIPSSVHEVLMMPNNPMMDSACLRDMITDVNESTVDDDEILSDHAYIYRYRSDEIENY